MNVLNYYNIILLVFLSFWFLDQLYYKYFRVNKNTTDHLLQIWIDVQRERVNVNKKRNKRHR
jgi:hypothetical protein